MTEAGELLDLGDIDLLPDILMMLDGTTLKAMAALVRKENNRPIPPMYRGSKYDKFSSAEIEENPLLALSPEELLTLRLYMRGYPIKLIAETLKCTTHTVRSRLARSHVREARRFMTTEIDEDLNSLYGSVVSDWQEGMDDVDKEFRLKIGDRIMKAIGKDGSGGRNIKETKDLGGVEEMLTVIMEKAEQSMGISGPESTKNTVQIDYKRRLQLSEDKE